MAATRNIVASYKGPIRVVRRILAQGEQENRALIYLMLGCLLVFIAQMPRLAREAFLTGEDLNMLMGATLMAWIFVAPLLLYAVAWMTYLITKLLRLGMRSYATRIALFWALLASSPIMLLWGMTAGFIGEGTELTLVGVIWACVFTWFWVGGLIAGARES